MYYNGRGVEQSYEKAFEYLEQAAHLGDAKAQYNLGFMYYNGQGVEQSYEKAKEYLEQAAHLGFSEAQYSLGEFYRTGEGVEQSYDRAFEYYQQAAQLGHPQAQYDVGRLYMTGDWGVQKSVKKTLMFLKMAGNSGITEALVMLACIYQQGMGVQKDLQMTIKWLTKAVELGNKDASKLLQAALDMAEHPAWTEHDSNSSDANIINCANCEIQQTETHTLIRCPCHSVRYCNKACQKNHRKEHKKECRRLLAERKSTTLCFK